MADKDRITIDDYHLLNDDLHISSYVFYIWRLSTSTADSSRVLAQEIGSLSQSSSLLIILAPSYRTSPFER